MRRLTAGHPFFADWDVGRLKAVAPHCQLVEAVRPAAVLELGDIDPYVYFLVAGELQLETADGDTRRIAAGDLDAGFPVAHLRPSRYRVLAQAGARLLRIEASRLRHAGGRGPARYRLEDTSVGGTWRSHPLVVTLRRRMRNGSLEVPSMPGIALRIRRALARDDYDMASFAAIVGADPAIAGRLIKVANSAVFGGHSPCDSVQAALVRLGVHRAQNLVLTLAARGLFEARGAVLRERVLEAWRHAIDIAALAAVLARLTPGLDSDRALLVGLLHGIGALPILELAEGFPDLLEQPGLLDEILYGSTPEVSDRVLAQWGFDDDFRAAALAQGNYFRDHEGGADYTDVLLVAHLHSLVRERAFHRLPRIDETPAFGKLALGRLSPQLSLTVLDEARDQVRELKSLLA